MSLGPATTLPAGVCKWHTCLRRKGVSIWLTRLPSIQTASTVELMVRLICLMVSGKYLLSIFPLVILILTCTVGSSDNGLCILIPRVLSLIVGRLIHLQPLKFKSGNNSNPLIIRFIISSGSFCHSMTIKAGAVRFGISGLVQSWSWAMVGRNETFFELSKLLNLCSGSSNNGTQAQGWARITNKNDPNHQNQEWVLHREPYFTPTFK